MTRDHVRSSLLAGVGIFVLAGIVAGYLYEDWSAYLSELSIVLYTLSMYVAAIVCLFGCHCELSRISIWKRSSWLTTPRSWIGVVARFLCSRYLVGVFIPMTVTQVGIISVSLLKGAQGYFDFRYAILAQVLSIIVYSLGVIISHLPFSKLVNYTISFIVGLFAGMYFYTPNGSSPWVILTKSAWFVAALLGCIVLIGLGLVVSRGSTSKVFSATIFTLLSIVVIFVFGSPQPSVDPRRGGGFSDAVCRETKVAENLICVWREDSYKLAALSDQVSRLHELENALDKELNESSSLRAFVYVEPGLKADLYESLAGKSDIRQIASSDGQPNSWRTAQGLAYGYLSHILCSSERESGDISGFDQEILLNIAANYIYGDIRFNEARTSNSVMNEEWNKAIERFSQSNNNAVDTWILMVKRHRASCSQ